MLFSPHILNHYSSYEVLVQFFSSEILGGMFSSSFSLYLIKWRYSGFTSCTIVFNFIYMLFLLLVLIVLLLLNFIIFYHFLSDFSFGWLFHQKIINFWYSSSSRSNKKFVRSWFYYRIKIRRRYISKIKQIHLYRPCSPFYIDTEYNLLCFHSLHLDDEHNKKKPMMGSLNLYNT